MKEDELKKAIQSAYKEILLEGTRYPWYVILLSLYPSLALLAHNIFEVSPSKVYRPLIISIAFTLVVSVIAYVFFKNWDKAGIATSLFVVLFFSYGHFYNYIQSWEIAGFLIGRHRFLLSLWAFLFIFGIIRLSRSASINEKAISFVRQISLILLFFPVFELGTYVFSQWQARQYVNPQSVFPTDYVPKKRPDVYFIVLDMYGRSDVLEDVFHYDDEPFLNRLDDMGFFIAQCSRSNYPTTETSLTATLNMNYLPSLDNSFSEADVNLPLLHRFLENNTVFRTFKELGYQTIAFETGYEWSELRSADTFYVHHSGATNSFEELLIRNSLFLVLDDFGYLDLLNLTSDEKKYSSVMYSLESLRKIPEMEEPTFVVAHIMLPHPPFVFGADGTFDVVPPHYKEGENYYTLDDFTLGVQNQTAFIENVIPGLVLDLLEKSAEPPIIIIQGDHGFRMVPDKEQYLANLSAYYFPEPKPDLNQFITPVNNFRMIFHTYFGADLNNLSDKSFFWEGSSGNFVEIKDNDCVPSN